MLESTNEILEKIIRRQVESQPENNIKHMGRMTSRSGGEGKDKSFRSPGKEVRLNVVCPAAMLTGREADVFHVGEGLDNKDCVVLERSRVVGDRTQ